RGRIGGGHASPEAICGSVDPDTGPHISTNGVEFEFHLHRRRQHSKPAPPVETPALLRRPSMAHRHISRARPGLPTPNLLRRREERPSPARVETTSPTVSPGGELRAVAPRLVFGRPSACLHAPSSAPAAAPSGFPPRARAEFRRGPGRIPAAARADSRRWPRQIPAGGKNNDPAYHGLDRTRHLLPSVVF